jgi:hypothetical protein
MRVVTAKFEKSVRNQKGSLALEQVLFIGAVVAMATGLYAFYGDISQYFTNVDFAAAPTGVGNSTPPAP